MQIDELIIDAGMPAIDAMRRLEETGRRILFLAPGGQLQAVLTDSDVRKFILRGGDLSCPVADVANHAPKWLPVERRGEARAFLVQHSIDAVPLLDKSGCIVDVIFLNDADGVGRRRMIRTPVVIMAGGLGTRLYPYTKILPKPLIPIGEVPILERVMDSFHSFGCEEFTLLVNYKKNMIKSYFSDTEKAYNINWVEEDAPLGTGGGLSLLKGKMREAFFLTNCDTLVNADYGDIVKAHQKEGNAITMVCVMKQFTIPYGVVELGGGGEMAGISEKPSLNYLVNAGMYLVEPEVVAQVADGVSQGFPDIMEQCRARGGRIGVYPIGEGSWMDMGQIEELDEMRRKFEQN
ncbi:MAG: NTP transferase domain-containing protein [Ruminococcaceae bacterium]|nr:NTP transferase domain-containing protein [Oscillospiraceae bacterium]